MSLGMMVIVALLLSESILALCCVTIVSVTDVSEGIMVP